MKHNPAVKNTDESSQAITGWHKEDIKAAIRKRGMNMVTLAIQYGVQPSLVRNCLGRPLISGERVIADFLGVPLHELWPERWTRTGERVRPRYAHLYTANGKIPKAKKTNSAGTANR